MWRKTLEAQEELCRAIEAAEGGKLQTLLDAPEGSARLGKWLRELYDLRQKADEQATADIMSSLTGYWGLSEEEAKLVLDRMGDGVKIAYEKGPCRTCRGTGHVDVFVRGTCFGEETRMERCMKCGGSGTDDQRLRVPA